ncbi:MAG: carbohydrate-binding protein [Steroidobacteraceae bacterium]
MTSKIIHRLMAGLAALLLLAATGAAQAAGTPYYGNPFVAPGSFEAEDFDRGGPQQGYRDLVAGNIGGLYRTAEDVDITRTADASGGYDIFHFQTGEWLAYTIDVPSASRYDLELRVSSTLSNSTFRILVDGANVSGTVAVPNTGGWNRYGWVGPRGVQLSAGRHVMRVVAVRQYFNLNTIRIRGSGGSTPYSGTPIPVPSDFEAEDFDRGGQGVAYRDLTAGNVGGQYRPAEDVDIAVSSDVIGGDYVVNHFETGEWLAYSINVGASGRYDLALRVASAMTGGAFHLELDGADVSGRVTVPNTGSWDAYQWVVRADVPLSAGTHVLKVVADQQYFNLNSLRVTPTGSSLPSGSAQALFRSGFEGTTALLPPLNCWGTGCWQDLIGLDSLSNFSWPPQLWGGGGKFLLLSEPVITTALNIGNRMFNRIDTVTGPRGNQTRSLLQQISYNVNGTGPMGSSSEQNEFQFLPRQETSDLYLSYWLKLQPDLVQKMATDYWGNNGTWRAIFAFKTGGQTAWGDPANNGDYRVEAYVRSSGGQMFWSILGDNNAGGGAPLVNNWNLENRSIPVPIGTWFKLEFFWHRSNGADGRIWMAANGQPIADRRGPNMGAWNLPINRIIAPMLYTGGAMPVYQWVDDLEIWDGFPAANGDNPPYAPH